MCVIVIFLLVAYKGLQRVFNIKSWKALLVMFVIVPVGLLTAFRLTGVSPEPVIISKTITADTVYWNISRPTSSDFPSASVPCIDVNKWVKNSYSDETISINFNISFVQYWENALGWPSDDDDDYFGSPYSLIINASNGYIHSATIQISGIDEQAEFFIQPEQDATFAENLKICSIKEKYGTHTNDAYVKATRINQPVNAALTAWTWFVFLDQNTLNHEILATGEIVCFNGTAYQRIIVPIQLGVIVN